MADQHTDRGEWFWRVLGISLTLAVAIVDYVTADEIEVVPFYLLPLAIAAWHLGRVESIGAALFCTATWLIEVRLSDRPVSNALVPYWNALMLLGTFSTVVILLGSLRRASAEQKRLIADLQSTLAHVKTLGGLLPICAWCKKIRDDSGYWLAVEAYLQDHSDAAFTHGICPDCSVKFQSQRRKHVKKL